MALLPLDYGSQQGGEVFETTKQYTNGEPRWAARADWYIRFKGYIAEGVSRAGLELDIPDLGSTRRLLFFDTDNDRRLTEARYDAGSFVYLFRQIAYADEIPTIVVDSITEIADADSPYSPSNKEVILATNSAADITIALPASPADSFTIVVKKLGASNKVVIEPDGVNTIDGAANYELTVENDKVKVVASGGSWYII